MATLLYHESTTHGMVATPARLGNSHAAPRQYHHEGHFLLVDGPDEDVEDILKIAGYRLATPAEQNAYRKQQEAANKLEEATTTDEGNEAAQADASQESKSPRQRRKG